VIIGQRPFFDQGHERPSAEEGSRAIVLRAAQPSDQRIGIYARGACHLRALFACAPLIQKILRGSCAIDYDGHNSRGRCDLVLQTLQNLPPEWTEPVIRKLQLPPDYFQPDLFKDTFTVETESGPEQFRKDVIVLHIAADATGRLAFRHREHGFLVDPGGGFLLNLDSVIGDSEVLSWFQQKFEPVAPLSIDEFSDQLATIIRLLRERGSPRIIVFNSLTVPLESLTHTWQLVRHLLPIRYRELHVSLCELSRKLDFIVVDLDRILKRCRIRTEIRMTRLNPQQNQLVIRELFDILRDTGVFD
jgi:hypothetical protein